MGAPTNFSKTLSDFSAQWCQDLFNSIDLVNTTSITRRPQHPADKKITNTLFSNTFNTDTTIRGWQIFQAKHIEPSNASPVYFLLLSFGDGLDGHKGILHGGMFGAITDQATSMCATFTIGPQPLLQR